GRSPSSSASLSSFRVIRVIRGCLFFLPPWREVAMRIGRLLLVLFAPLPLFAALPESAPPKNERPPFVFRDVGAEVGLFPHLDGSRGHAAAWGDVDGDGWPDLFVGTYANSGKPGQLLRNRKGKFTLDKQVRIDA